MTSSALSTWCLVASFKVLSYCIVGLLASCGLFLLFSFFFLWFGRMSVTQNGIHDEGDYEELRCIIDEGGRGAARTKTATDPAG